MHPQAQLPPFRPAAASRVVVVEAPRGSERSAALAEWVRGAEREGARAWRFSADTDLGGVWAGVNEWVEEILPRMAAAAPELVEAHGDELAIVVPRLRRVPRRLTLTDTAPAAEAVRNYALDRAYRIGQGVVDLLAEWHQQAEGGAWVVVCEDLERAGALARHFFRELVRRRGGVLELTFVAVVEPGAGDDVAAELAQLAPTERLALATAAEPAAPVDPAAAARTAEELEARIAADSAEFDTLFPRVITAWLQAGRPERAAHWQMLALGTLNHNGFYQDADRYVEPVVASLDHLAATEHEYSRWDIVGNAFGTLIATGQVDRAQAVLQDVALPAIDNAADRVRALYVLAMVYARYQPRPDFAAGEECIQQAQQELARAELPPEDRHFMHVFLNNGLAFIRHRQGRPDEAAELTRAGFDELNAHLPPDRHQLHRSVLQYNTAQVYAATGRHEDAVASYTAAMEMDPHYSEYYNERGNSYLALGRHAEAVADYRKAIELSSPYAEVWINLGQCLRAMGELAGAADAYSRALDLDPRRVLARVGRAQVLSALGRADEAIADYDVLLAADASQPLWLANRAVLHHSAGRPAEALRDLNAAIALQPRFAPLYANRSVALAELHRPEDAARDLETYLALAPDAPNRAEVEVRIAVLREGTRTVPVEA